MLQPISSHEHPKLNCFLTSALSQNKPVSTSFVFNFNGPIDSTAHNPSSTSSTFLPILPWLREDWKCSLPSQNIPTLHEAPCHTKESVLFKLARQHSSSHNDPNEIVTTIKNLEHIKCDKTETLPRVPKFSFPPESHPNFTVSLDVCFQIVEHWSRDMMVVLDHDNILFGALFFPIVLLSPLSNATSQTIYTALTLFCSR